MKDLNYVIGRLQGLNDLVKILRGLIDKKGGTQNPEIVAVITKHISDQLDSIISEFDSLEVGPTHKEALMQLKEKHSPTPPTTTDDAEESNSDEEDAEQENEEESNSKIDKHEKTVDDLLRDLESLKSS